MSLNLVHTWAMLPRLGLSRNLNNVRRTSEGRQSRPRMLSLMSEVTAFVSISARAAEKHLLARAALSLVSWSQYDKMYPRTGLGRSWIVTRDFLWDAVILLRQSDICARSRADIVGEQITLVMGRIGG